MGAAIVNVGRLMVMGFSMVDKVEFSLIGLDSLLGKFSAVNYDVKRKGGRSSLRKAAQLLAGELAANWRALDDAETGRAIADNVALRWDGKLFKYSGNLGFRVGILQGAVTPKKGEPQLEKSAGSPTPHWRLIEFGTEKLAASPIMRNALENNINAITDTFITEYDKALDRAIKRAGKKSVV